MWTPEDVAEAVWTHGTRELATGTPSAPTNLAEEIAEAVWTFGTRELTIPPITLPDQAGFLGFQRAKPAPFNVRRVLHSLPRFVAPPLGRQRYYQRWIGLWRAFNAAVYRIYWQAGSPPTPGTTPYATSASLPYTIPGAFSDGAHYLSVSWFNGVLDSGFLPIGPAGETWIRFDMMSGSPVQSPPRAPLNFRAELQAWPNWRFHGVYAEDGDNRADEWVIYHLVDSDGTSDPLTGTRKTVAMAYSGVAILSYDDTTGPGTGEYGVLLVRTAKDGVESENVTPFIIAGDSDGPTFVHSGFSQWTGAAPAEG